MEILSEQDYHKVYTALNQVTINHLFARSVVEQKVVGTIYVDHPLTPTTFYIIHPYGMTLLLGDSTNAMFNHAFKSYALNLNGVRNSFEWMQAFPSDWDNVLSELFKDQLIKSSENINKKETGIIELNTRVNFKFNIAKYLARPKTKSSPEVQIVRTDLEIFKAMKGSVVPSYFWRNENDFWENGVGFSLFYKNQLASTAYSAFIQDQKLEFGIETVEAFRGKGFAEQSCLALIDYCINHHLEPVWACRLENTGSYKLAQKIGFEPSTEIPYYRLSK